MQISKRSSMRDLQEGNPWRPSRSLLPRFSVSCIVVAILGYGMMSMYWCCWLSFESGCCSVSWPWGEVARDRARPYGPPYGTRIPCLPKTTSPTNRGVPRRFFFWRHKEQTRFSRQPAAPIHAHHSIDKDSDHNTGRVSAARAGIFFGVVSSPGGFSSPPFSAFGFSCASPCES